MYILDVHNDIRNHVASGQESRGALGNQPPAADMFLLVSFPRFVKYLF